MIFKIADLLRDQLASLNFVEVNAGLTKTTPFYTKGQEGETVVEKIIPLAYNDLGMSCETATLFDLVPDTRYRSMLWWVDRGTNLIEEQTYYYQVQSTLRLIAWFNLPLIDHTLTDASLLVANIIATIPNRLTNVDYLSQLRVQFIGEETEGVLDEYSFHIAENHLYTHPYYVSALDFAVDFAFGKNCVDAITLNPTICP